MTPEADLHIYRANDGVVQCGFALKSGFEYCIGFGRSSCAPNAPKGGGEGGLDLVYEPKADSTKEILWRAA